MAFLTHSPSIRRRATAAAVLLLLSALTRPPDSPAQDAAGKNTAENRGSSFAQAQAFTEYEVKAEVLVRLTHPQFTDWPDGVFGVDDETIILAVVGEDRFRGSLGRAVQERERPYVIWRIEDLDDFSLDVPPHVVFVSSSAHDDYELILEALEAFPVLTVGEDRDFLRAGGLVSLRIEGIRPVIEIARARAEDRGFRFSSQLLRVARIYPGAEDSR